MGWEKNNHVDTQASEEAGGEAHGAAPSAHGSTIKDQQQRRVSTAACRRLNTGAGA